MKPLILVVDDNEDILLNIQVTLEFNDYEVITAKNGIEGLNVLSELKKSPDLIISDIMMPEMDGYDFFKNVSGNLRWNRIPFLFLTARTSPTEIRFGKMLGVDDYLTKPFKKEDLLAIISGKIARTKKIRSIDEELRARLTSLSTDLSPSISEEEKEFLILFLMIWDDKTGPTLEIYYPDDKEFPFSIEKVGVQLFNSISSIYGQGNIIEAQGILLNIENINRYGYIYFDSFPDERIRGGERQFMLAAITLKINYFDSMKIKELFKEISPNIKESENWDIAQYWEKISNILSTPLI